MEASPGFAEAHEPGTRTYLFDGRSSESRLGMPDRHFRREAFLSTCRALIWPQAVSTTAAIASTILGTWPRFCRLTVQWQQVGSCHPSLPANIVDWVAL